MQTIASVMHRTAAIGDHIKVLE
jgi:hypothetical protein